MECTTTPVWVPPKADTAYCRDRALGGVSATVVYVGDVSPEIAAPVIGDEGAKAKVFTLRIELRTLDIISGRMDS